MQRVIIVVKIVKGKERKSVCILLVIFIPVFDISRALIISWALCHNCIVEQYLFIKYDYARNLSSMKENI